jgi:DNA modification methylase
LFKLIHGDCSHILRNMRDKSVDCIFTDPPYVIGAQGCGLAGDRKYLHDIHDANLNAGFDAILLEEFLRLLSRPNLFIFCSRLQLRDYLNWVHDRQLNWSLICWHKTNPTPLTGSGYLPDTEYLFHFWKHAPMRGPYRTKRHFYVQPTCKNTIGHPTVKPLNIVKNLLLNAVTAQGSLILDPFMGSGTTGVAAIQLGHRFIGIELNRDYLAIASRRIAEARPDFNLTIDTVASEGKYQCLNIQTSLKSNGTSSSENLTTESSAKSEQQSPNA